MVPYFLTDDISASAETAAEFGATVFMGPMEVPGAGIMALVTDPTVPCTDSGKRASSRASASPTRPMHRGGTTTRPMTRPRPRPYLHTLTGTPSSNVTGDAGP